MKKLQSFGMLALVAAIVATPSVGLAKDNGKSKSNQDHGCRRAIGHLIAPGWIKVHGQVSVSNNCHLPPGILKKLGNGNGNATSTDTVAPVVRDIEITATARRAVISWTTNEKSKSSVFYGTTTPSVTATSTGGLKEFFYQKDHEITLRNLSASTTYYAVILSRDASGNVAISDAVSFITQPFPGDNFAPVITNIVTVVGTSSLNVLWKTNEPATSRVFYGTTAVDTNASSTLQVSDSSLTTNHSLSVSGLATSTLYHLVLRSVDASGNVRTSADFSASTSF